VTTADNNKAKNKTQREEDMRRASLVLRSVALCLVGAFATPAQAYPDRPIRLIVSIAAGSVTDVIMRAAANELNARLGQPLIIENKGGASGILAAQACAQAAPDGYTLCTIYHSTTSYNPLQFEKLPYDADSDFAPITRLFLLSEGLFVASSLGVDSVAALKSLAQAKPESLNFATLGDGSFPDLFRVWLNNQWGTKIVGVPYKGGAPAAQALMAGEVQLTRFGIGNFTGALQSGAVKALAVHTEKRSPLLPNVPTFAEAGLNYPGQGWWGLAAPKGTPPDIVAKINQEFVRLLREPKFIAYLEAQSVIAAPTSPEEFARFMKDDRKAAEGLISVAKTPKTEYREH
jgi:tripartite-type tricarboxylate transporter receptor subunit TctC